MGEKSKPAAFKPKAAAPVFKSIFAEVLEGKTGVLKNLEEKSFGKISGVNGNHERLSRGMLQDEVRAGLACPVIALPKQKANELAGGNHLFQREGNGFGVNGAGGRNGLAFLQTMPDVKAHGFQDAFLGLLDRLTQAIDAREIIAIGVVALALALNSDRIAVEGHLEIKFIMKM